MSSSSSSAIISSSTDVSTTMDIESYAIHSKNQYAAHLLTRDLLSSSMERLVARWKSEDEDDTIHKQRKSSSGVVPRRRRRIADLGTADGASTMETLRFAIETSSAGIGSSTIITKRLPPLHITFEEHPASAQEKLHSTLNQHKGWFRQHDITYDVLMKSFYEPLFDTQSMDFIMSYICLHWLDITDVAVVGEGKSSIADWKTLGCCADNNNGITNNTHNNNNNNNKNNNDMSHNNLEWTQINEATAPQHVRDAWRTKLAHCHFAKFLQLRANELRPGAELFLVMVGMPHEYVVPSDGGAGPLTRAMKRCIARGELREAILHRTVVPYYLRTVEDIPPALTIANQETITKGNGGGLLDLVNCKSLSTITKGNDGDDPIHGAFELYCGIHSHAIEAANPTKEELQCIKAELRKVFYEIYDKAGIPGSFVACTFRRRP